MTSKELIMSPVSNLKTRGRNVLKVGPENSSELSLCNHYELN